MNIHDIRRTQYPSTLRSKRFRGAELPVSHDFAFEDDASSGAPGLANPALQEGQHFSNPSCHTLSLTDSITPRPLPTASSVETTMSSLATAYSITTILTTSFSEAVETKVADIGISSSTTAAVHDTTPASKNDGHGSNTGPIIGGTVASIVAVAILVIPLVWRFRRRQRERLADVITPFNSNASRRPALFNKDTTGISVASSKCNRGPKVKFGPANAAMSANMQTSSTTLRPPCAIASKATRTYTAPGQSFNNSKRMPYTPRQVAHPSLQNPFITPAQSYSSLLQSPSSPPPTEHIPAPRVAKPQFAAISTRPQRLVKSHISSLRVVNGSATTTEEGNETMDKYTALEKEVPPDSYVDISRSSVSSFQVAQYEDISRKLDIDVPKGWRDTIIDYYLFLGRRP